MPRSVRPLPPFTFKEKGMKHPTQKIIDGRFVTNNIVWFLLRSGGVTLPQLDCMDFDDEDRMQFSQLIGCSLNGYSELEYVTDTAYQKAIFLEEQPELKDAEAEMLVISTKLARARKLVKELTTELFRIHPDDLKE